MTTQLMEPLFLQVRHKLFVGIDPAECAKIIPQDSPFSTD